MAMSIGVGKGGDPGDGLSGDVIPHNGKKGINDVGKNILINLKHLHHSRAMNLMYFLLVSGAMFIRFSLWCRKFSKQFFLYFPFL